MGNMEDNINLDEIEYVVFKPYEGSSGYEINNISEILIDDENYIITAHGLQVTFLKENIKIKRIADAS